MNPNGMPSPPATSCPHTVCGTGHEQTITYSAVALGDGLARFFQQLARLLQLLGDLLNTYNKTLDKHYIVVVDQHTKVWTPSLIKASMDKVLAFYKKYKINIHYTIDERSGVRSVEQEQRLIPKGDYPNIFLVDEFSDCKDCTRKGYENSIYVLARYYEHNNQPSFYLWTTIAHEIGHNLGLKQHGGTLKNLMNEMGPAHDTINQVELTICQVAKMKR